MSEERQWGELRIIPNPKHWSCAICFREVSKAAPTNWFSSKLEREVEICQACCALAMKMSRVMFYFLEKDIPERKVKV